MLRTVALASLACATTVLVAGCGRQITPSPSSTNANLAGHILVRFRTVGKLDFTKYDYAVVIDACGGGTPYPNVYASTFTDYTYSFNVGTTSYGAATTFPILLQYLLTPGVSNSLNPQVVPISASLTTFNPNSAATGGNVQGNEFTLIFDRLQLANPKVATNPCPTNITPVNGPAATTPGQQTTTWSFNFFTIAQNAAGQYTVLDSLGFGAGQDVSYNQAIVDTLVGSQQQIIKTPDTGSGGPPSDMSAQILGGEIDNYP